MTSPWGDVIHMMDEKEGMALVELDLDRIDQVREQLPLLKQRRLDIYELSQLG